MRLKSEKARKDRLAHLEKETRRLEERFPHFPLWLALLKQHSPQPLKRLDTLEWPETFYRATGAARPMQGLKKLYLPHEYTFFSYVTAQAARERVVRAPLQAKPRGAVPRPDDAPQHEPKRKPKR